MAEIAFAANCTVDIDLRNVPKEDYEEAKEWALNHGCENITELSFTIQLYHLHSDKKILVSIQRYVDRDYLGDLLGADTLNDMRKAASL